MIAQLPEGLRWLSESKAVPAHAQGVGIYVRNNSGNPLIMDAIYVDAPGAIVVTSISFAHGHFLAGPVPVHSVRAVGRPRLLPIVVFRSLRIESSQELTVRLYSLDAEDQTVSVLIRCREVYP